MVATVPTEMLEDQGGSMPGTRKVSAFVDVTDQGLEGCHQVGFDLYLPEELGPQPVLWCCIPGGGVSRAYFDFDLPLEFGEFSMARVVAQQGMPVLLIDPPGTGGSDRPTDGNLLTPERVSDVLHRVVREVVQRLASGSIEGTPSVRCRWILGLGHSAGALLVACQQAHHGTFDALALLGFSDTGLIDVLNEEERSFIGRPAELVAALPSLAQARFGGPLPARPFADLDQPVAGGSPSSLLEADRRAGTQLLALVGLMAIIPGSMKPELDEIDVPVLAAVGEHDIAGDVGLVAGQLPQCHDLTLVTLPGVGHNHNLSPSRLILWERIIRWLPSVLPPRNEMVAGDASLGRPSQQYEPPEGSSGVRL
jgi:pimeloyl-ACP methyl ester carboxylesterase